MMTPEERYHREPDFRALVDTMYQFIVQARYTPTEMREAAMLAAIKYDRTHVRSWDYGSQGAIGDPVSPSSDGVPAMLKEIERLKALNAELAYSLQGFVKFPNVAANGLDLDELKRSIEEEAIGLITRSQGRFPFSG